MKIEAIKGEYKAFLDRTYSQADVIYCAFGGKERRKPERWPLSLSISPCQRAIGGREEIPLHLGLGDLHRDCRLHQDRPTLAAFKRVMHELAAV